MDRQLVPLRTEASSIQNQVHAHLPDVRQRKWLLLRFIFRVISQASYPKGAFQQALWSSSSIPWDAIPMGFFISMSIQAFTFDRKLKMDLKLKDLFVCFKKDLTADAIDSREVICSIKVLEEFRKSQHDINVLMDEFLEIYSKKIHFFERADLLELISLCAISEEEMKSTRGELDNFITSYGPRHGLKPTCRQVTKVVLQEIFEEHPELLIEFRTQCWDRLTDDMRTTVLKENIAHSQAIVETHELRIKLHQATMLWRNNLLRKSYCLWKLFLDSRQRMHLQRSWMLEGYALNACRKWHHWAVIKVGQRQRKYIAGLMGEVRLTRKVFYRLKKNWANERKIFWATLPLSNRGKKIRLGAAKADWAIRRRNGRVALQHWCEYAQINLALDLADHLYLDALVRRVFYAFIKVMREIIGVRNYEVDALHRQKKLFEMLKEADDEFLENQKAIEFAEEKRLEYEAKREKERKLKEKQEKEARKKEWKEENIALLLEVQQEMRRKRVELERLKLVQEHFDEWNAKMDKELRKARKKYVEWLKTPESWPETEREFKVLRRDFYAAPTPERQEREDKLKNLANIVFCNVTSRLFKEKITLEDLFTAVDPSGSGFVDYEEFEELFQILGITLSPDQRLQVIQTVDADKDGFVSFDEFQAAMKAVEGVCGYEGSVWRMFVDPSQAVLCFFNTETEEKIYDYDMQDEKLKEICLEQMTAKYMTAKRDEIVKLRDNDLEDRKRQYAARALQKMFRRRQGAKARAKHRLVMDTRKYRKDRTEKIGAVFLLQRWTRCRNARKRAKFRMQITYEKVPDPESGVLFYFNHATMESSWTPSPQLVQYGVELPDPIDWYRQMDEEGKIEYRNWKTGECQEAKPSGFPMCLACAASLASRECKNCNFAYCFKCFRISHNHKEYENHEWKVVTPVVCIACKKYLVQKRCTDCCKSFCEKCFTRAHKEGTGNEHHSSLQI